MKLDPVFTVKENKLYKISDNSLVDINSFKRIEIKWSTVELEPELYNEEFLANLREELKQSDDKNEFVILVPVADKELKSAEQAESFTNAFNHTARRIKDCICVAGIELPQELTANGFEQNCFASDFMQTLAIKHAQYVYFSKVIKGTNIPSDVVIL